MVIRIIAWAICGTLYFTCAGIVFVCAALMYSCVKIIDVIEDKYDKD